MASVTVPGVCAPCDMGIRTHKRENPGADNESTLGFSVIRARQVNDPSRRYQAIQPLRRLLKPPPLRLPKPRS